VIARIPLCYVVFCAKNTCNERENCCHTVYQGSEHCSVHRYINPIIVAFLITHKGDLVSNMDKEFYRRHANMCGVFAHPLRLELLQLLHERGESTVGDLAEATGVRMANLSQHLAVMRSTNIVLSRKEGVSVYYRLADPRIMQAFDLITEVMLSNMAHEEELRQEFALHLQDSTG
jgi:DNA-binding transcriptional ArsR family regulator